MPKKNGVPKNCYLNGAEILAAAKMIPSKKAKNGSGRAAEISAKRLGISASTMYQAKAVLKNASEKDLQNLRDNKVSIKKIYNKNKSAVNITPLKKAVDILERNNYRVLKIEEVLDNPHAFCGTLNLQIVPKEPAE
ncbi:MAG: hypothetical protein LBV17_03930 [Treponema sp.]|jgi:hypothetical protein|nr:hypothetical protein [Treponema sp.]